MLVYCTHPMPSYHNIRGRWLVAFIGAGDDLGIGVFRTEIVTAAAGSHLSSVVIHNEPQLQSSTIDTRYTRASGSV